MNENLENENKEKSRETQAEIKPDNHEKTK